MVAVAAIVIVVIALPGVKRLLSADRSVARAQLRYGRAVVGDLEHTVAVEGRVVAASRPTLFSPADGIVSVPVAEGQRIATGDVLAVVESPELESRLRQERATTEALASMASRLELASRNGGGLIVTCRMPLDLSRETAVSADDTRGTHGPL